jgi:nucleoside-diphosphate-sugar epimerase
MLTHLNLTPLTPTRVVVLGQNGFVPGALVRSLSTRGWPVLALGKDALDLTEEAAVAKLAALLRPTDALVMTSALTPEKGKDTATLILNLRMGQHVAAAVAASPCSQVVYFSSDSVYGWEHATIAESTPPSPDNLYGVMHLAREIGLREACKKAGLPLAVLRACAIYGSGDTHNAYGPNRFVRTALKGGRIELFGTGDDIRDQVYIDDVVRLTGLVLEHRSEGILNLVSGTAVTFAQVAKIISDLAGHPIETVHLHRSGPATRRAFASAVREAAFPGFAATPLSHGLSALLSQTHGT